MAALALLTFGPRFPSLPSPSPPFCRSHTSDEMTSYIRQHPSALTHSLFSRPADLSLPLPGLVLGFCLPPSNPPFLMSGTHQNISSHHSPFTDLLLVCRLLFSSPLGTETLSATQIHSLPHCVHSQLAKSVLNSTNPFTKALL
ncbi:hypothetical protein Mapa_012158 [Marchantia paleacea]|nr:hypothetical protein Mapa_012158 [Marchantia paleacea]